MSEKHGKNTKKIIPIILCGCLIITAAIFGLACPGGIGSIKDYSEDKRLNEKISSMSVDEKVGQMFMGCFYNELPSQETIDKYHMGFVLLFKNSFKDMDKNSLPETLTLLKKNSKSNPVFAVDEEGGTVNRLSSFPQFREKPFTSPRKLYETGGMEAVLSETVEKNQLLSDMGIDMNLAPVCDISLSPNDFMYSRSLGQNETITSEYVTSVTKLCNKKGIISALKHFPGYGNAADTHKGLVKDERSLDEFKEKDLLPFKAGINAGAPAVLISHNIINTMDENHPASLSPEIHQMLRNKMNFDGIIITDDLSMEAIDQFSDGKNPAVAAILAGNDLLCTGDFNTQYNSVLKAIDEGTITENRIDDSVKRILKCKEAIGKKTTTKP